MQSPEVIQPVEGEVITLSSKKAYWGIGLFALLAAIGFAMIWYWKSGREFLILDVNFATIIGVCGISYAALGCLGSLFAIWITFIEQEHLIIGHDCLQIVVMKGGKQVVNVQLPYDGMQKSYMSNRPGEALSKFK